MRFCYCFYAVTCVCVIGFNKQGCQIENSKINYFKKIILGGFLERQETSVIITGQILPPF